MECDNYPEFFLGNLRSTRLVVIEWLKRGQRKRFLARYSGVGLVCAVNVEFGFLNKFLSQKIREKVVLSFRCNPRVKETV